MLFLLIVRSSRLQAEKPDVVIPAEEQMASEEGKSKQTIFTARNKLGLCEYSSVRVMSLLLFV